MDEQRSQDWVVGVDGSSLSEQALRWAIARGAERFADVRAIRSWDPSVIGLPAVSALDVAPDPPPTLDADMRELIARIDTTGVPVEWSLEYGPAAGVLLNASQDADLLVVGSRGLGGFKRLVLGSVSHQCATHATVPVAVIPPNTALTAPLGRIVVGVDGSDNARAALRWAIGYALAGTSVVAVGVGEPSPLATTADRDRDIERTAETEREFEHVVAEVLARVPTEATVTAQFWSGNAVETLLSEGAEADLLVIGARGHGRLGSALLGSISNRILHHSKRPVVVVPDRTH